MEKLVRIFLIENETDAVRLVVFRLKKMGFEVDSAENGLQAVEKLRKSAPDMIFASENIPIFDIYRLCARIKTDEKLKGVPLIVIAKDGAKAGALAGELKADDFVVKPYGAEQLKEKIDKFICRGTHES